MQTGPCNVFCEEEIATGLEDSQNLRQGRFHACPLSFIENAADDRLKYDKIKRVGFVRDVCCVNNLIDDVICDPVEHVQGDGFPDNASYVATDDFHAARGQKQRQAAASRTDVNGVQTGAVLWQHLLPEAQRRRPGRNVPFENITQERTFAGATGIASAHRADRRGSSEGGHGMVSRQGRSSRGPGGPGGHRPILEVVAGGV